MTTLLITGARQGLGLEVARQYAAETDWQIIATCLEPDSAADLQAIAQGAGGRVSIRELDVDDHPAIERLSSDLAGQPIDILLNNAGRKGPEEQTFGDYDYVRWNDVLRTNLFGPMKMTEAFVDNIAASTRKLVVTFASGTGSMTYNAMDAAGPKAGGLIYYRSSKAGINMMTRNLAVELKDRGVSVVSLAPGHVRTEMGGTWAPLSIEESVRGVRQVIEGLSIADSGSFLLYDGSTYPW
jgi:NAD(P)-dependent dehydrogenase (short-subunit alcohol dehydrogenase family)